MAALDAVHNWDEGGMPIAERRTRIAEIDRQLEELVDKRDTLASQLISVGITE